MLKLPIMSIKNKLFILKTFELLIIIVYIFRASKYIYFFFYSVGICIINNKYNSIKL